MPDFTLHTFHLLLSSLKEQQYNFQSFKDFLSAPAPRSVILRHDVDRLPENSQVIAEIEKEIGIHGTYYFRAGKEGFDNDAITQIARMGHEIGYHYEDLSLAAQGSGLRAQSKEQMEEELVKIAFESFRENLEKMRGIVPVKTICMHGSPLSRWDNRLLWKYYDYRDFGITGEPYFDVDFGEVLYLTDTGRRWDGQGVSVRDKAEERGRSFSIRLRSTFDIINAARENKLPDRIMLTIHPQRWDGRPLPWMRELVWQNLKNTGKWVLNRWKLKGTTE